MPITHAWYDAQETILVQKFIGKWTLDEYIDSVIAMTTLYAAKSHTVHVIGDLSESTMAPTNLLSARGVVEKNTPDNRGLAIVIKPGRFIEMLLKIVRTVTPRFSQDLHVVDSLEEALARIAEYDRTP